MEELHEYLTDGAVNSERVAILKRAECDGDCIEEESAFRVRSFCFQ